MFCVVDQPVFLDLIISEPHISERYVFSAASPRRVNNGGLAPVQRPDKSLVYLCDMKHNGQPRDFIVGRFGAHRSGLQCV